MPLIRFVLICVLPAIVMITCGLRMLQNIRHSRQRVMQAMVVVIDPTAASRENNADGDNRRKQAILHHMLLLMVLVNVVVYIITQLPFNIYTLYYGYGIADNFSLYSLLRAFFLMWSSVYFGIGFYLYCVTSLEFRKQFVTQIKHLFICHRQLQRQA